MKQDKNQSKQIKSKDASVPLLEFLKTNWLPVSILFILPFVLYFQSIQFGYVLDDQIVITENDFTKDGLSGIDDILTTESMAGYFGEQKNLVQGNRYRPLSIVTFAVEYAINGGLNPAMSHFINILLYSLTGFLLFKLLLLMFPIKGNQRWWLSLAFMISVLYIAHPIHSEAVANIKGRDEVLVMLFSLATLYAVLKYVMVEKTKWLYGSFGLFFLAFLSKENAITFLAIIPITMYFFTSANRRQYFSVLSGLLGVTIAYLALRFWASGVPQLNQEITDLMNNPFVGMRADERGATIMLTLWKYIQLFIYPHPLSHDYYPYAIPKLSWDDYRSLGSLFFHIGLVVLAIVGIRKKAIYAYGILFYLSALSIVSNIVINVGTFMNERFIYMASLGLTIILGWVIFSIKNKWSGQKGMWLAALLFTGISVAYAAKTIARVPAWENAYALNKSAVDGGSNSARANSFMATAIFEKYKNEPDRDLKLQQLILAQQYADKAVALYPNYKNGNLMKVGIAAEIFKIDGDEKKMLAVFKDVMGRRPDIPFIKEFLDYLEGRTRDMDYLLRWYADASVYMLNQGIDPGYALQYMNDALEIDTEHKSVNRALARIYAVLGDNVNSEYYQSRSQ